MINKRGPKTGAPREGIVGAFRMSRASWAASYLCRPKCRRSIATWLKRRSAMA